MLTKYNWEELSKKLDNMTDEEFEKSLIEAGIENCPEIEEKDEKGFEIKCLDCGSTNCEVLPEWDESYDETPYISGYKLWCSNCLQTKY